MPKLHLQVFGGLCSRMRAVIGGIAYCEHTGRELVIDWTHRAHSLPSGVFEAKLSDIWQHDYEVTEVGHSLQKDWEALDGAGDVELRTCTWVPFKNYFRRPFGEYFQKLTPTPFVQSELDAIRPKLRAPLVAVNIRYDIAQPNTAPVEWFIERIRAIRKLCPHAAFYLSADDRSVSEQVHREGDIIENTKTYRYDRVGIIRQAVDLYVMSWADWLVGSNQSSFSQLAAMIRGATLIDDWDIRSAHYEDAKNPPSQDALEVALNPI